MIGKLPTLSSSRALVSSLFLYYDATKFSSKFTDVEGFDKDESPEVRSPQKHDNKDVAYFKIKGLKFLKKGVHFLFKCSFN